MGERTNKLLIGGIVGFGVLTALSKLLKAGRRFELAGKTVLITGGSRGLGLVTARRFAEENCRIAICARDADELERARIDLENRGADVFIKVCDVQNQAEVERFVKDVTAHFGSVDVLVNNAGVIQVGALENQTQKDFEDALAVHFWGAFYMMQAVLPQMRERGAGRIANIASIGGKFAVPHLAPYCASKFALVGLSDALRGELRKDNIFVTTVCPGLMRTGSHVNALFKGQNEKEFAWFSLGNASPLSSVSAESAANKIVEAVVKGDAELIISPQAKLASAASNLFPELTTEIAALVNRLLPAAGGIGERVTTGRASTSKISPSFLTANLDCAAYRNNELGADEILI